MSMCLDINLWLSRHEYMQASLCHQSCLTAEVAAGLRESWQDGTAFQALAARQAELSEQRETIEAARKVGLGF